LPSLGSIRSNRSAPVVLIVEDFDHNRTKPCLPEDLATTVVRVLDGARPTA
jgi:hypothetical protein